MKMLTGAVYVLAHLLMMQAREGSGLGVIAQDGYMKIALKMMILTSRTVFCPLC